MAVARLRRVKGPKGDEGEVGPRGPKGERGSVGPKGDTGPQGATGFSGPAGANGAQGPAGVGVPAGGATGQVLAKIDGVDYNTEWVTGGGGGLDETTANGLYLRLDTTNDPLTNSLEIQTGPNPDQLVMESDLDVPVSVVFQNTGAGEVSRISSEQSADWLSIQTSLSDIRFDSGASFFLQANGVLLLQGSASVLGQEEIRIYKKFFIAPQNTPGFVKNAATGEITGGHGITSGDVSDYQAENKDAGALSIGMAVATHSSGVGVVKARADSIATRCVGLSMTATNPTLTATIKTGGVLALANWTAITGSANLAANTVYFLSSTTAGLLTNTPTTTTGEFVQRIGTAVSPTELNIEIQQPIKL